VILAPTRALTLVTLGAGATFVAGVSLALHPVDGAVVPFAPATEERKVVSYTGQVCPLLDLA